jgi:hypothetical protein
MCQLNKLEPDDIGSVNVCAFAALLPHKQNAFHFPYDFPVRVLFCISYVPLILPQRLGHVSTVNSFLLCRPQQMANVRRGLIHLPRVEIASVSKEPDETHNLTHGVHKMALSKKKIV